MYYHKFGDQFLLIFFLVQCQLIKLSGKYFIQRNGIVDRSNLLFFDSGAIEDFIPARRYEGLDAFLGTSFSQAFSGNPSTIPSEMPSKLSPNILPSIVQSSAPSADPPQQPTQSSSALPSVVLPSVPKTLVPSASPSLSLGVEPSAVPTEQLALLPSALSPSTDPRALPSLAPTSAIIVSPSFSPVVRHSAVPTTEQPLTLPTQFPSSEPHLIRSSVPTFYPISNYESSAVYSNFTHSQSAVVENVPEGVYPVVFSTFSYLGNSVVGNCSEWKAFIRTKFGIKQNALSFSAIEVSFGNEITDIISGSRVSYTNRFTCSNSIVAANLASNMLNGINFVATCDNDHQWRTFTCSNGGTVLCVDCPLSCFSHSCAGKQSMIVNPCQNSTLCQNYSLSQGILVTAYSILRFDMVGKIQYPTFLSPLSYISAQNQLTISANISCRGIVYCAAYKNGSNLNPRSVSDIESSGFYGTNINSHATVIAVDVLALEPDSNYRIYCATSDFYANFMDLATIKASKIIANTACCKRIIFDTPSNTEIVSGSSLQRMSTSPFTFHLNAQPTTNEIIQITISSLPSCIYASPNRTRPTIFPSNGFRFASDSTSFSGSFVVFGPAGCYSLRASSSLSKEFQSAQLEFKIRSASTPPPPPQLSSAIMSNDGLQIFLTFDSPTDAAQTVILNYNAQFSCNSLLSFRNKIISSSCQWQSSNSLVVSLSATVKSSNSVSVGDLVQILPNKIKPYCSLSSNTDCATYTYATNSSTLSALVWAPLKPIVPYASLNGPNSAWAYSSILLDPTSSTGSGPQPWSKLTWGVSSTDWSRENVSVLIQYLQTNFPTTLGLVNIPGAYTFPGSFNVSLTLTNVFGRSSYTEISIHAQAKITIPLVSILGPRVIRMSRSQPILLAANATFSYFLNDSQQVYDWKLYDGLVYLPNQRSISVNKKYYSLPAYALEASRVYTLLLTVYSKSLPSQAAQASTRLSVGQSGVTAKISGGIARSVSLLDDTYIDASGSYDLDYPSRPLNYTWRCVELSPSYQQPCALYSVVLNSSNNEVTFHLVPTIGSDLTTSYVYNFTVTVANKRGSTASAYTTLTLLPVASPALSIQAAEKYDAGKKVIITGNVLNSDANRAATVSWSLSGINLTASVLTPVQSIVGANSALTFQLSFRPFSFSPGKTYTLRLSASNSYFPNAFVEARIVINTSPYGGKLSVAPKRGFEFNTTFSFTTSLWFSPVDNYPLTYSFSYYDVSMDSQVYILQSQSSVVPYVNSILSKGLSSTNFSVYCITYVTDRYGSSSNTATAVVQVFPTASISASYALYSRALTSATDGGDLSSIASAVVTIANSISSLSCVSAPNCSALNRMNCKSTPNTCGTCYSGYVGVDGDANSLCGNPSKILRIGETCSSSSSSCVSGNCVNYVCMDSAKLCPNNCSRSGVCMYYSYYQQTQIQNCLSGDTSCYARCNCRAYSFGGDCSQSSETLASAQNLRASLCSALFQSLHSQDVSTSVIASRASTVANIMTDLTLLTPNSFEMCTNVLLVSIFEYPFLSADSAVVGSMIGAFDSVLSKGSDIPPPLLSNISRALSLLSTSLQSLLVTGEKPSIFTTSTLSMLAVKDYLQPVGTAVYQSPQSAYNAFNNMPSTVASIGTASDRNGRLLASSTYTAGSVIGMNLVQYLNNPTGSSQLFSDIVLETTVDSSVDSSSSILAQVTVQSLRHVDYSSHPFEVKLNLCPLQSTASNISITCANGISYNAVCPASAKPIAVNFSCPASTRNSQCTSFNGTKFTPNMACRAIHYSPTNTTCLCTLPRNESSSTDFSATYHDVSGIGSYNIVVISNTIAPTINSSSRSVIIAITTAVMSLALLFAYCVRFRWNKLHSKEKYQQTQSSKPKNLSRTFKRFFQKCVPIEYSQNPSFKSFLSMLFAEHIFFNGFFVLPSNQNNNRDTFLYAVARILNVIALDTAVVIFFFDVSFSPCSNTHSESACQSYNQLLSKVCEWDSRRKSCLYMAPSTSFVNIIVVVIVVMILSIPLEKFSKFLVSLFLEALVSKKISPTNMEDAGSEIDDIFDVNANIDELELVQTKKNTIIRAAALGSMQANIDSFSPIAELNYLIARKHVYEPEGNMERNTTNTNSYFQFYANSGAPYTRADFLQNTSPAAQRSMIQKLEICRSEAHSIKAELVKLPEETDKDLYLMKQFLTNFLRGYKSIIAKSVLLKEQQSLYLYSSTKLKSAALLLLPLYLFGVLVFTITFGLQIHDTVAIIWIICGVIAIAEDGIWIQPAVIYLTNVSIPGLAKKDFMAILFVVSNRAKSVLSRETFSIMKNSQALIQHFHPACRAARLVPHLAVSRLLMSITDYDLPISHLLISDKYPMLRRWVGNGKPWSSSLGRVYKWVCDALETLMTIYLSIPHWLQVFTLEILAAVTLNGLVIVLYLCFLVSIGLVVAITIITTALFLFGLYYMFPDLFMYFYTTFIGKYSNSSSVSNFSDFEDLRDSTPNDAFVDSNVNYEIALPLRLKPSVEVESNLAFSAAIRVKPDTMSAGMNSGQSSSIRSEQPPRVVVPGKTHSVTIGGVESDVEKDLDDAAFFESPAAYMYSRKYNNKGVLAKPDAPVSPHTQSEAYNPPSSIAKDVISVEKARKIRATVREVSKKQRSRHLKVLPADILFQKSTTESGEAMHDSDFTATLFQESANSSCSSPPGSAGKIMHFGTPYYSKSSSNVHSSEEESSPPIDDLAQQRKLAIRKRLSLNQKKTDHSPSALSVDELTQKIAALSSLTPGAASSAAFITAGNRSSVVDAQTDNVKKKKSGTVTFAVDMLPSSPLHLKPFKDSSNRTAGNISNSDLMQLSSGPHISNCGSLELSNAESTAAGVIPHSLLGEGKSPMHFRPLRNRLDQSELHIVTIKSPGVERNESNLGNELKESIGNNNRTAILSPGSTSDSIASPMLSDIRSPNLNRIKLDPLDRPARRAHRRKISTLQDRSKQLLSQSQPSSGAVSSMSSPHPLDAAARQNLIKNAMLSKSNENEKEDNENAPASKAVEFLDVLLLLPEETDD